MSLLGSWFGRGGRSRRLDMPMRAAIERWRGIDAADLRAPLSAQTWLVVDVETSGLDVRRDRLLAIGAVLVEGSAIRFAQSFEVVIKQATASRTDNILIHRISGSEQIDGVDAASALVAFLDFAGKLPCVAFHAGFDETMLKRAVAEHLGFDFSAQFIDLALLAPALVHDAPSSLRSLDDWAGYYSITISARHRAVADALGSAQLFQVLLRLAAARQYDSAGALFRLARGQRWLDRLNRR